MTGDVNLVTNGTRQEVYDQLSQLFQDLSNDFGNSNEDVNRFKTTISGILEDSFDTDALDSANDRIKKYAQAEILSNDDASASYNNLVDAVDNYNTALSSGEGVDDAKQKLLEAKQAAEDSTKDITNSGKVLQDVYNQISGSAPIEIRVKFGTISDEELQQYQDDINALKERLGYKLNPSDAEDAKKNSKVDSFVDGLSDDDRTLLINAKLPDDVKTYTKEQLADLLTQLQNQADENSIDITPTTLSSAWEQLKTSTDDATKGVADDLQALADKGELTIDTFKKVDGAENYFDNLGISAGEAVNYINQLSDKNSQVSAMRKNIQSITEALGSKQTDGFATADDFAGFDATIKGLNSWKEFTTLLGDAKSSMEDCQTAANNLATEYVNSNEVICQLDDSTAEYFRTQMTSMGVSNADAVVEQRLTYLHAQQAEDC